MHFEVPETRPEVIYILELAGRAEIVDPKLFAENRYGGHEMKMKMWPRHNMLRPELNGFSFFLN